MPAPEEKGPGSPTGIAETALAVSGIGGWEWTADDGRVHWLGRWDQILGLDPTDSKVRVRDFLAWVLPEDSEAWGTAARAMVAGERLDVQFRMKPPDGRVRWVRLRGQRLDAAGRHRMVGTVEDVTERTSERLRLQSREEEYRVLTEYAVDVILRTDVERRILYVSKSCELLLGYTQRELVGQDCLSFAHEADAAQIEQGMTGIMFGPGHSTATFRVRHKDGHWIWTETVGHAIRDSPDEWIREILFVMRDSSRRVEAEQQEQRAKAALLQARGTLEKQVQQRTTELREANDQLARSEQILRSIVESAPAVIQTIDPEGRVLTANRQTFERPDADDVIGKSILDFVLPKDRPALSAVLKKVFDEGATTYFEAESPKGGWFGGNYAPIIENGKATAAILVMSDITARREAEARTRRSEALFRDLADSTPIMMWLLTADGRATWANRAFLEFLGGSTATAASHIDRIHPEEVDRTTRKFNDCVQRRTTFETETRLRRHDGVYRDVIATALPRSDAAGEFSGYVGSCVDVTEIRLAEAANAEHQNRLAHSLRLESLDQMALGLAHELHQPLAAISAAAGAALRGLAGNTPDVPRIREMLDEAQGQAIRGGALLEEMRRFIRKGTEDHPTVAHADVELNELVESVAALARPEAGRRGIRLEMALADQHLGVFASRVQLQQILINIVQNGLEAISRGARDGGTLRIETEATARGDFAIRVLDTGCGISPGDEAEIFDVFFTTRADGLGMGLAISRSIAEAHGGTLHGENRPAGGAIFTLTLPAAQNNAAQGITD